MKNQSAVALGSIKSRRKALSSQHNGKKGGRPRKVMEIPLQDGLVALVDGVDYKEVSKYQWSAYKIRNVTYAGRGYRDSITGKRTTIWMHRFIMDTPRDMFTDHISGDGLDNRRSNLRICTREDNNKNVGMRRHNTSGFKGVVFSPRSKSKWIAQIHANGKLNYLGLFPTRELAYEAYCKACEKYHGEFANY